MSKKIELRGLFGTRWMFRAVGASRGLGIHAFKSDNRGDNPDVNVGLSVNQAKELRDFLVEKFGPGEGYVKVGEGMVNATAEELPERRFKVGDRVQIKAGDPRAHKRRLKLDNPWIGRTGSVALVKPAAKDKYAYEVKIDGDDSATLLPVHEDEVEPEVTWKYKVGDMVKVNNEAPVLLRGIVGKVDATHPHPSVTPDSPWAYTVRDASNGTAYTFSESELDPYVGQTLGDLLDRLPEGTVIHFDRDSATANCWAKRSDGWYSTRNDIKLNYLLDRSPRIWPFTVVYNPDTDN